MATVYAVAADWSYANHDPQAIKDAGYVIGLRYLGNDDRCIDAAERDAFYRVGLRLAVIGQRGAVDRPRSGYTGGSADGAFFQAQADLLGWPNHKPILCAIADVGSGFPTAADMPAIKEYFRGLYDNIRRPIGIYGPYWVLEEFRNDSRVFCYWQTAGGSGSGSGTGGSIHNEGDGSWRRLSSLVCMYQEYGDERVPATDHNEILEEHWTRWSYHPSDIDSTPEEDDMPAPKTHYFTSSKANRSWLEKVPGFNEQVEALPGGWDHPWAGLGTWETIDFQNTIRQVSNQTYDLAKALLYIQLVNGEEPSMVDHGFMDTKWFECRTWMPGDFMYDGQPHDVEANSTDPVVLDKAVPEA
jgi:hypothetical protein